MTRAGSAQKKRRVIAAFFASSSNLIFVSLLQPIIAYKYSKINIISAKNDTNGGDLMKQRTDENGKNLVGSRLKLLRTKENLSQRDLARELQLIGIDMDKNVITRIETNKRYVNDFELRALKEIFGVSYDYLIDGIE